MDGAIQLTRLLPAVAQSPGVARKSLDCLHRDVEGQVLEDARLLVSELVTNALRHSGMNTGETIELQVKLSGPGVLRVVVSDPGPGFPPPKFDSRLDRSSGWGLHLLQAIAHRWGRTQDEKNRVWFEIEDARRRENGAAR